MTITDFIASLRVGDTITYQMKTGQTTKQKIITRTGVIKQILEKFITVQLDKYPDSVEINEIAQGRIKVLDANGEPIPIEAEILRVSEPPILPIEHSKPSKIEIEPGQCARTIRGTVNWEVMWPLVEAELAKGKNRNDVAKQFGISPDALKSRCKRTKTTQDLKDESLLGLSQLRGKSRKELLNMQTCLQAQGKIIDVIVSCIDATLQGEGVAQ